jgi:hypothetical protein
MDVVEHQQHQVPGNHEKATTEWWMDGCGRISEATHTAATGTRKLRKAVFVQRPSLFWHQLAHVTLEAISTWDGFEGKLMAAVC